LPLETSEVDPEEIIRKGKTTKKSTSIVVPSFSDNLHNTSLQTPVTISDSPIIQIARVSRNLNFGSFPTNFSPPILGLEGESFDTPFSPKVVKRYLQERSLTLEYFPTSDFTIHPPIRVVSVIEGETFVTSSPSSLSPNTQAFPFSPISTSPVSPVLTPSPSSSPPVHIQMAGDNPPKTRMEAIIASRYAPLVLPQPLNSLPADGYLKQLPKFTGEGDVAAEEHLEVFYSFTYCHVIMDADVWMRIFFHSLEGEARKWFRALPPRSIDGIEALYEAFLKNWEGRKDFLYYIIEFGSLKKKEGESVSDFSKRFNKMYSRIPIEVKPTETYAKITYSSSFDPDLCLLLRERRATSLAHMQDASIEVQSNIMAVDELRSKVDRDRRRGRYETSTSSSVAHPQDDELTKLVKSLSPDMEKVKLEARQTYRNTQNVDNRGTFERPNNAPQTLPREPRNRGRDDQRIQTPLQNNLVDEEDEEDEKMILRSIAWVTPLHPLT
jgi:hypothetical protein